MIKTSVEEYKNYGRVLRIDDGALDVRVTLDLGPRVIYCALKGKNNIFFEDLERRTCCEKEEMSAADDLELVAVITAAIHAYESAKGIPVSTDDFVVRSIKRRR